MTYKYSLHQSNQSYDLQYDLQSEYDWPTASLLLLSTATESETQSVRQNEQQLPFNAATPLPPSSSRRQHHERESTYPRCIGGYNPITKDRQAELGMRTLAP